MHRSGTNFLSDLLLLHPRCEAGLPAEDFLVAHTDLLVKYARSTSKEWSPHWKVKQYLDQPEWVVMRHIGEGLMSFLKLQVEAEATHDDQKILAPSPQKRLVTKTPSVKNLQNFFKIFPNAQLIVLIRDGRSVVESGMQSFRWNFEVRAHAWADAARTILACAPQTPNTDGRYLIVKYEDVYQETEKEMKRILSFLGLETNCYDFEKAANLPVRGSSEEHRKGKGHHHWEPIEKTPDFNPLTRWSYWGQAKRRRFNWIAGEYLAYFGYCQPTELKVSVFWQIWNVILDIRYAVRTVLAQLKRLLMKLWRGRVPAQC